MAEHLAARDAEVHGLKRHLDDNEEARVVLAEVHRLQIENARWNLTLKPGTLKPQPDSWLDITQESVRIPARPANVPTGTGLPTVRSYACFTWGIHEIPSLPGVWYRGLAQLSKY